MDLLNSRTLKKTFVFFASMALGSCAVLKVDVDVYKGPLADHKDIQVERLAAMAVGVAPVISWVQNSLISECEKIKGLKPQDYSALECGQWAGVSNFLDDSNNLKEIDRKHLAVIQNLEVVYAVRDLYKNKSETTDDDQRLLSYANIAKESIKSALKSEAIARDREGSSFSPNQKLIAKLTEISKDSISKDKPSARSCLAEAYLQFLEPKERGTRATPESDMPSKRKWTTDWRDEDAILSLHHKYLLDDGREHTNNYVSSKELKNLRKRLANGNEQENKPNLYNSMPKACFGSIANGNAEKDDAYDHVPGNWGYRKLSERKFLLEDSNFIFDDPQDDELKQTFVADVAIAASSVIETRELFEKSFLVILDAIRLYDSPTLSLDQYEKNQILREAAKLVSEEMIGPYFKQNVLNKCISIEQQDVKNNLTGLLKLKDPDKDSGKDTVQMQLFKNLSGQSAEIAPVDYAFVIKRTHQYLKQGCYGHGTYESYKSAFGVLRAPDGSNLSKIENSGVHDTISMFAAQLNSRLSSLSRGRLEAGLYKHIDEYLATSKHASSLNCKTNLSKECQEKNALADILLDELTRFSTKLLVLADYQPLINPGEDDSSYTSASKKGAVSSRDVEKFTRVLQSVGNTIRVQTNDIRSQQFHKRKVAEHRNAQVNAIKDIFNFNPESAMNRLLAMVDGDIERSEAALAALPAAHTQPSNALHSFTIDVLENDIDLNGSDDIASITLINNPGNEWSVDDNKIKLEVSSSVAVGETREVSYQVKDKAGSTSDAKLTVNLFISNQAPPSCTATKTIGEDVAGPVTWSLQDLSCSTADTNGDKVVLSHATASNGVVNQTKAGSPISYTPRKNSTSQDMVKFYTHDGKHGLIENTLTVDITAENDKPIAPNRYIYLKLDDKEETETVSLLKGDGDIGAFDVDNQDTDLSCTLVYSDDKDTKNLKVKQNDESGCNLDVDVSGDAFSELYEYTVSDGNISSTGKLLVVAGAESVSENEIIQKIDDLAEITDITKAITVTKASLVPKGRVAEQNNVFNLTIENRDDEEIFIETQANGDYLVYLHSLGEDVKELNFSYYLYAGDAKQVKKYQAKAAVNIANVDPIARDDFKVVNRQTVPNDPNSTQRTALDKRIMELKALKTTLKDNGPAIIDNMGGHTDVNNARRLWDSVAQVLQVREKSATGDAKKSLTDALAMLSRRDLPLELPESFGDKPMDSRLDDNGVIGVIDELITVLRARRIHAATELGPLSNERAETALLQAYRQRADLLYIRPALTYLHSAFATSSLLNNNLHWKNLLAEHGIRGARIGPRKKPDRDEQEVIEKLDAQFWHPINQVRVAGGGNTNYAIAKDDLGNWYVKGYSNDVSSIANAATSLATYNISGGGIAPTLANAQDGEIDTTPGSEAQANGQTTITVDNGLASKHEQFRQEFNENLTTILKQIEEDAESVQASLDSAINLGDHVESEIDEGLDATELISETKEPEITEENPLRVKLVFDRINSFLRYFTNVEGTINSAMAPPPADDPSSQPGSEAEQQFMNQKVTAVATARAIIIRERVEAYIRDTQNAVNQYKTAVEIIGQLGPETN